MEAPPYHHLVLQYVEVRQFIDTDNMQGVPGHIVDDPRLFVDHMVMGL